MKKKIRIELVFVKNLKPKKIKKSSARTPEQEDEWLDNLQAMKFLNIGRTAFFEQAREGNWTVQLRGRRKYFLKSSLIKNQ